MPPNNKQEINKEMQVQLILTNSGIRVKNNHEKETPNEKIK
jgi:hypothetical protein